MNKHIKRISIAVIAVALVFAAAGWAYQQSLDLRIAIGVGGLVGISLLHTHLAQLARDQAARGATRIA